MTDSTPAEEPKVEYRELIRNIACELNKEELHILSLVSDSESGKLASALSKMGGIPMQKIEEDIFEQRSAMDEESRQDEEDKFGGLNQEGLFPHEVEPD
jgi:ABC-type dipeptide/oligopeptide/nickel transport system ATPase component